VLIVDPPHHVVDLKPPQLIYALLAGELAKETNLAVTPLPSSSSSDATRAAGLQVLHSSNVGAAS